MNLTLNMNKTLDAHISSKLCINCDSCGKICPVSAIEEKERQIEGLHLASREHLIPSSAGCPLGIVPQVIIDYVKSDRICDAAEYIYDKNPLAKLCATVCNQYCRRSDRRGMYQGEATNIRALERYVLDKVDSRPQHYRTKYQERIAVIGGGPAGIVAAHQLASIGYDVTIFEKDKSLGGSMAWGIPGFRLDKDMLDIEIEKVISGGIHIKTEVCVGQDITLDELRKEYQAVLIAVGASAGAVLNFEGSQGQGVVDGVSVLRDINLKPEENLESVGDEVVVIGGGRFAVDLARTLARKGKNVACVAMEEPNKLQIPREYIKAMIAEGIKFIPKAAPVRIERSGDKLIGVEFGVVTTITEEDGQSSQTISSEDGFKIPCDTVVFAVGRQFDVKDIGNFRHYEDGVIKTDRFNRTSASNVFACGDITGISNSVVGAMTSGQKAALSIDSVLRRRQFPVRKATVVAGSNELITKDEIAMVKPAHEELIFSKRGRRDYRPAEDCMAIIRAAGIEEQMQVLITEEMKQSGKLPKVAIIGGGIAGITAAIALAKNGYNPTIFEKTPCLGGRYRWLATDKRIDNDMLEGELAKVAQAGIDVVCNASAGIKPSISELKAVGFDAILFAIGETRGIRPNVENNYAMGTFEMVSLASRLVRNLVVNGIGKSVMVTGSDEMAVDVARKLKEYSSDVTLVSACSKEELLAHTEALGDALEEGVNLVTGTKLVGVKTTDGRVSAIELNVISKELNIDVACDTLVIGDTQKADTVTIVARNPALKTREDGALMTDNNLQTAIKGVLSIGNYPISSVQAGIVGAQAVACYFMGTELGVNLDEQYKSEGAPTHEIIEGQTMADMGFEVGKKLLTEKQAKQEASRFLPVGYHVVNNSRCIGCGICAEACPEGAIELVACGEVE